MISVSPSIIHVSQATAQNLANFDGAAPKQHVQRELEKVSAGFPVACPDALEKGKSQNQYQSKLCCTDGRVGTGWRSPSESRLPPCSEYALSLLAPHSEEASWSFRVHQDFRKICHPTFRSGRPASNHLSESRQRVTNRDTLQKVKNNGHAVKQLHTEHQLNEKYRSQILRALKSLLFFVITIWVAGLNWAKHND